MRHLSVAEEPKQCVVITGSSGGIGSALASAFLSAGYHVIAIDRVGPPATGHQNFVYLNADLQQIVENSAYAQKFCKELEGMIQDRCLRALVNNAAIQQLAPVEEISRGDWASTMEVNVSAPFFLLQMLLKQLEEASGCVVNIGSIHASLTKPGFTAYATSKAALRGLTQATAVELGARIRVNLIEPAAIATDMLKAGFQDNPEGFAALGDCHPVGRIGTPEELARLVLQIVNGDLQFLNGSIIRLDGGIGARLHDPA
jgi:NAD(P)-dependent dehydrogenase (short-subunit alcohol dehydrogenase family)